MMRLIQKLFVFLGAADDKELAEQLQFLKVENEILRSKLPQRISLTEPERNRLVKFGKLLGPAIKELITRRGTTELIDVVIKWRGIPESRHVVHQGTRRYDQLADFERLKARVAELRRQGLTATQTADALDKEGFRTPRGGRYSCHRVRRVSNFLKQTNSLPGTCPEDLPQRNEWWIRDLAIELGMETATMRQWCRLEWIRTRKLPGRNGRIIAWADRKEIRRLRRLLTHCRRHPNDPVPQELSRPNIQAPAKETQRKTTR